MNIAQVEAAINKLSKKINNKTFVYDFLLAYGTPAATITMLKNGSRNLSKKEGEIICKKKILFYSNDKINVEKAFEEIISEDSSFRHDPRFILVTDYEKLYALDTKLHEKIIFDLKDLPKKFDFFLPLAGVEKKEFQHESPVDVKAAEKLSKLFDLIKLNNPKSDEASLHALNVFLTRLLFCYFAEDTDIFPKGLFTKSIASHTQEDGSDLSDYLKKFFAVMNIEERPKGMPDYIAAFPYVNGGLFATSYPIPVFCKRSRAALIDVGDLDWAEINPDIFGSMIQAVVHPDQRAGLGMHYTSVNNIMKVIEPLFLNDLYEEFEKSKKSENKLRKLLKRLSEIKVFDPACGSGNFLIIAYKELRKLEMAIYNELPNEFKFSYIPLKNFYGIEIDDFAHEVAILSLWLTEHQMDILFKEEFGEAKASLPLRDGGNIYCENSLRVDWERCCKIEKDDEVYLLGNPPYAGYSVQNKEQKEDMELVFDKEKNYMNLDYISCFFYKASKFIKLKNSQAAFVSTNSVCQGEQVSFLWPKILKNGVEIGFAHQSFKWSNLAKSNAGVACIILGIRNGSNREKYIFYDGKKTSVKNINPYLVNSKTIYVTKRKNPISNIQNIGYGSSALDGGHLVLSPEEKMDLISHDSRSSKFIFKLIGSQELLKGIERWTLWIEDADLEEALDIEEIRKRIELVRKFRLSSKRKSTKDAASRPQRYAEARFNKKSVLVIPKVSSERRLYLPVGIFQSNVVISDLAFPIYDPEPHMFGIVSSLLHSLWVKAVGGRLESRLRYSSQICYNNFPIPDITKEKKEEIFIASLEVIKAREKYQNTPLSKIYNPESMPTELIEAHALLDKIVEGVYFSKQFSSDQERLDHLFELYSIMKKERK